MIAQPNAAVWGGGAFTDDSSKLRAGQAVKDGSAAHGGGGDLLALVESLPEAVFQLDSSGDIQYVSPQVERLCGISPSELLGRNCLDFMHPEDRAYASQLISRAQSGEAVFGLGRLISRDGSGRLVRSTMQPLFEGERVVGVAGVMSDIGARRSVEVERERLNRELRAVSACHQAIMRAELERSLLSDVCRIICAQAGYSAAWVGYHGAERGRIETMAACGLTQQEVDSFGVRWDEQPSGQGALGRCLRVGETVYVGDLRNDPGMSHWRPILEEHGWLSCIALPLRDDAGVVFGGIVIYSRRLHACNADEIHLLEELAADLAFGVCVLRARERRRTAEQERERLTRELMAINACHQAMARAADEASLLQEVCRIVCEIAGYQSAWVGAPQNDEARSMRVLAVSGDGADYIRQTRVSWAEDDYGRGPTGTAAREGRMVYVQNSAADPRVAAWRDYIVARGYCSSISLPLRVVDAAPYPALSLYSTHSDIFTIDELRLLEELADDVSFGLRSLREAGRRAAAEQERERLRQHLQQSQKMEAVGRLAGGVAHDFNNVLSVVLGYSDLLLHSPAMGERDRARVEAIQKAGDHAASLTRQLLIFSRKQILQPRAVNINRVICGMEKVLRRLIGEDIDVRLQLDGDLACVRIDPGQLEQIVFNLCINARDAMPLGGRLCLQTRNEPQGPPGLADGPYVRFAVIDTGVGMTPETLSHVFEPFFTTKGPEKGTGLGLATVYGIAQQAGGVVWAESSPGEGSSFYVCLPAVAAPDADEADAARPSAPHGSETVLLVEDSSQVRALTREILEGCGYVVHEAADPERALALDLELDGRYQLLVTDVVMPGFSGPVLAERLRAMRPELRVLFISGYADYAALQNASLPAECFLQKPFSLTELARKVREVLDRPLP